MKSSTLALDNEQEAAAFPTSFTVVFADCIESIGVTSVATQRVRALVPAEFRLAGEEEPITPLIVRAARCDAIAVADHRPTTGAIIQIGAVIVSPDATGDINTYTLWYYTSDTRLALYLRRLGLDTQYVPTIDYDDVAGNVPPPFSVTLPRPGDPPLSLAGAVLAGDRSASWVANWWAKVGDSNIKMSTTAHTVLFGHADLVLTTDPDSSLGQLIGGESVGFTVIDHFNIFAQATMRVSKRSEAKA